jgi:hypothetical protein
MSDNIIFKVPKYNKRVDRFWGEMIYVRITEYKPSEKYSEGEKIIFRDGKLRYYNFNSSCIELSDFSPITEEEFYTAKMWASTQLGIEPPNFIKKEESKDSWFKKVERILKADITQLKISCKTEE